MAARIDKIVISELAATEPRNSWFLQKMCELQLRILLMEKLLCFPTYAIFMRIIMYECVLCHIVPILTEN
jgi:hypothetical protein